MKQGLFTLGLSVALSIMAGCRSQQEGWKLVWEENWKKSTTYTVLRRLCQKGIFISENGVVTSLLSKQMFQARQSEEIIEESFAGSLPDFVAAFTSRKKLSKKEIKELKKIIENNGGAKE